MNHKTAALTSLHTSWSSLQRTPLVRKNVETETTSFSSLSTSVTVFLRLLKARDDLWHAHQYVSNFHWQLPFRSIHNPLLSPVLAFFSSVVTPHIFLLALSSHEHPILLKASLTAHKTPSAPCVVGLSEDKKEVMRLPVVVIYDTATVLFLTWYASTCPSTLTETATALSKFVARSLLPILAIHSRHSQWCTGSYIELI